MRRSFLYSRLHRVYRLYARKTAIKVKLWYRLAPQEMADAVLGKGQLIIPKVLMASDKKKMQL
jgi:hypothetical protein